MASTCRVFPGSRVPIARRAPAGLLVGLMLGWLGWGPGTAAAAAAGNAASPVGVWLTEDRGGVVRVQPCGDRLCGVIVGLSDWPKTGTKVDIYGRPQCHLTLINGLRAGDDGRWHGSITNPEDGKTYSADVWVPADGTLRLRGYFGLSIFGVTQLWPAYRGALREDCHFGAGG